MPTRPAIDKGLSAYQATNKRADVLFDYLGDLHVEGRDREALNLAGAVQNLVLAVKAGQAVVTTKSADDRTLVIRYKDAGASQATTKAAPGMQTVELPTALAAQLAAARAKVGDAQIAALLQQASQAQPAPAADAKAQPTKPQQKRVKPEVNQPAMKASAQPTGWDLYNAALDAAAKEGIR